MEIVNKDGYLFEVSDPMELRNSVHLDIRDDISDKWEGHERCDIYDGCG
jgi:hypothetical protein